MWAPSSTRPPRSRMYSQGLTTDRAWLRAAVGQVKRGRARRAAAATLPLSTLLPPGARRLRTKAQSRVQLTSEESSGECNCGVCVPDTLTALAKTAHRRDRRVTSRSCSSGAISLWLRRDTAGPLRRLHLSGARSADAGARRGQRHLSRRRSARTRRHSAKRRSSRPPIGAPRYGHTISCPAR